MTRRIRIQKLHLIVLAIMLCFYQKVHAQTKMAKERLDSVQLSVVNFFKEKKCFDKGMNPEKCLKTIYINGLGPSKYLGDDQVGIYHAGVLISSFHKRFLLIVDSNSWKIENGDPAEELDDLADYFKSHHISKEEIDLYLKKLLEIHEYNRPQ